MRWQIVPRTYRKRELDFDEEMVAALLNDETIEILDDYNRRLYQNVATENGYRLRTTKKRGGTTAVWFEKLLDAKIKTPDEEPVAIPVGAKV